MKKQQMRIGDLAKELNLEKFVIRFWEKEFNIKSRRSEGKQRFYAASDLERFRQIKTLLYDEGFTIAGAKKQLEEEKRMKKGLHPVSKTTLEQPSPSTDNLNEQISSVYEQLLKLRELL